MDSFLYTIWAFTILGAVLITLVAVKYPIRRISRTTEQQRPYSHRDLLQVNATIIAGLFILLTFQNIVSGGISELIWIFDTDKQISMYNDTKNNPKEDPVVIMEAERRFAESTLNAREYLIKFETHDKSKLALILLHPIGWLLISLGMFVLSSIVLLTSRNTQGVRFHLGESFTTIGFVFMGGAILIVLIFAKF